MHPEVFIHPTAVIDEPCTIGAGTKIWHFSHVMADAVIGRNCNLGQNVFVASRVVIGNRVKVQNNVSIYEGVTLEADVFCGPSCVFTNVATPRAELPVAGAYERTLVCRGATLGANATVLAGHRVGRYALVGAGAVITRDVPDYALMLGVPARRAGTVGRHGKRLIRNEQSRIWHCPVSGFRYEAQPSGELRCLDLGEEEPLPPPVNGDRL